MEAAINQKAVRMATEYLSASAEPADFDKVFLVYKLLATPTHVLQQGLITMTQESATQYFKRLAKQLHPDKNSHPESKEAFQRLKVAFDQTKTTY